MERWEARDITVVAGLTFREGEMNVMNGKERCEEENVEYLS